MFAMTRSPNIKTIVACALCLQLAAGTTRDSARKRLEEAERARAGDSGGRAAGGVGGVPTVAGTGSSNQVAAASGLEPVEFLKRFGYLAERSGEEPDKFSRLLEQAVGKFQGYMGVYQSNIIDSITTKHMKRPRCGNKDTAPGEPLPPDEEEGEAPEEGRPAPPAPEPEARWLTKSGQLSYKLVNYPSRLRNRRADVDEVFKQAFATWEAVAPIRFERKTSGDANLDIHFIANEHECPAGPLHRAGGDTPILAHTFGPPKGARPARGAAGAPEDTLDGDIHFNDHILWTVDHNGSASADGKAGARSSQSLLATAIHQIGHSLGLKHSRLLGSKMFPIEAGQVKLNESDKASIQQIYRPRRRQQADNYFAIENRRLPDASLDLAGHELSNVASLDECADFGTRHRINLTVWDRNRHTCAAKSTQPAPTWALYSTAGKRIDGYNLRGFDQDTSELESDVSQWVASRQCDAIVRLAEWPTRGRTSYKCKVFKEDDCCVMLFRLGRDRSQADLLQANSNH